MMIAAIYARYSSSRQRKESIEDQVAACRSSAEAAGDEVAEVYADEAKSGTTTERRDAFRQMMADAKSGRFRRLWVYKTDRFARNRYDSAIHKHRLKVSGVEVRMGLALVELEEGGLSPDGYWAATRYALGTADPEKVDLAMRCVAAGCVPVARLFEGV